MRIGTLELRRLPAVTAAANGNGAKPLKPAPEHGASGTINHDGFLQSTDYNPSLTGRRGLETYNRMRLSDATVREALWHIYAPILNATWDVQPASDDPLDLEVAAFSKRCFLEWLTEPFSQVARTALLFLPQGYQVFETVEQIIEAEITYDVPLGAAVTCPRRQFVVWRRFAHRRPETISKWMVKNGELSEIEQVVYAEGKITNPRIPASQLVVLTNEKEGDEFTGTSILRSSYKAWYLKEMIEKVAAMAYERHGVGTPIGYLPEALQADATAMTRLESILRDMRAGEHHYIAMPGPKAGTTENGRDGWLIEILSPGGSIPDFLPMLGYLRGEIKGNVLARFAELGHGSTGARATGDVQSQVWYDALQCTANYVAAVFSDALKRLIDKNYIVENYPRLVARDIEARNLTDYADATSKLVSSSAAVADRSLRASVRQYMGWPEEDEPEEAGEMDEYEPEELPAPFEDDEPEPEKPEAEEPSEE